MEKKNKQILISVFLLAVVIGVCIGAALIFKINVHDKSNLFAYAIDLENENWAYAPKGLDYGMTIEEVIKADEIVNYTWEKQNKIFCTKQTIKEPFGQIKEYDLVKRYIFDEEGGLESVQCEIVTDYFYQETIRRLLYKQALEYMPEANRRTEVEDIVEVPEKLKVAYNVTMKSFRIQGNDSYLSMEGKIPATMVVWEDTVYSSEDENLALTHANSDAILKISLQYSGKMTISLSVGKYENRLTEAEIQLLRQTYPIYNPGKAEELGTGHPLDALRGNSTLVVAEIMNESLTYEESWGSGNGVYPYQIEVVTDSEGLFEKGEVIYLYCTKDDWYYEPKFDQGTRLAFIITEHDLERDPKRWEVSWEEMYYVTEDNHVLSMFNESAYHYYYERYKISESSISGLTLEDLEQKLRSQ